MGGCTAANPDQRHDVGSRGLSPVASLVVTLVRAGVGSVFQTCNSLRNACFRPWAKQCASPSSLVLTAHWHAAPGQRC